MNTNNILAKLSRQGDVLEGYFLIDFALFKENMPLLYDQRYLEMSYLVHAGTRGSMTGVIDLIARLSEHDMLETRQVPIDMAGVNAAVRAGRISFESWVKENHPSLQDDLWGQYWLAGTAAGLSYCHKAGQAEEIRLAGLIYAAANLRRYFNLFGISMPREASHLYSEGQFGARDRLARGAVSAARQVKLPAPPTSFVGREGKIAEIADLLLEGDARLITLTGPGGTGKTRLGLETARATAERFRHGVSFIDLSPIRDPELVASTAAHALDIREGGSRPPLENLKDYLRDKQILLFFDNFEQVVDSAQVVNDLLNAAPGLKVIATSRIALQLRGEQEYPVSPLRTPPTAERSLEEISKYEAISLFRQQARMVKPQFEITGENVTAVTEICQYGRFLLGPPSMYWGCDQASAVRSIYQTPAGPRRERK